MSEREADFALDEIYNLAFKDVLRLIEHGEPGKQYEIWLRKGLRSDNKFAFHNVLTGKSIHDENVKPIQLVVNWTPNIYDAGRILRRLVEAAAEYDKRHLAEAEKRVDHTLPDGPPNPPLKPATTPRRKPWPKRRPFKPSRMQWLSIIVPSAAIIVAALITVWFST